jgi:hypothetical protein
MQTTTDHSSTKDFSQKKSNCPNERKLQNMHNIQDSPNKPERLPNKNPTVKTSA